MAVHFSTTVTFVPGTSWSTSRVLNPMFWARRWQGIWYATRPGPLPWKSVASVPSCRRAARYSKRSWVAAATFSVASPGTSIGYSFFSTYEQVGWGTTTRAPASTRGPRRARFRRAFSVAEATSPPSRYGMPQQTCSGQATAQPFFSSTLTASRPTWGSL